jgi:hypothetical protein
MAFVSKRRRNETETMFLTYDACCLSEHAKEEIYEVV